MEELITTVTRFGISISQDAKDTYIHFVLSPRNVLKLCLEDFLMCLYHIRESASIGNMYGALCIVAVDRHKCKLAYEDTHSPTAVLVRHELGVVRYKDLLTAINMELNTLRLRDRREEVFKLPEWSMDGGPFW